MSEHTDRCRFNEVASYKITCLGVVQTIYYHEASRAYAVGMTRASKDAKTVLPLTFVCTVEAAAIYESWEAITKRDAGLMLHVNAMEVANLLAYASARPFFQASASEAR